MRPHGLRRRHSNYQRLLHPRALTGLCVVCREGREESNQLICVDTTALEGVPDREGLFHFALDIDGTTLGGLLAQWAAPRDCIHPHVDIVDAYGCMLVARTLHPH